MIEFLKEPIAGPIIGLIGAAIIVPLVKKFYFDVQNRLRVEVRPWSYKVSETLKKTVETSLEHISFSDPVRQLVRALGYMTVTITNISKRRISGVSVTVPSADMETIWQIDDADQAITVTRGKIIDVGDIQPKHSRVIHIWAPVDISTFHFEWFRRFLRISANELDSVSLRFPMPQYLWKKYEPRFMIASSLFCIATLFFSLYFNLIR